MINRIAKYTFPTHGWWVGKGGIFVEINKWMILFWDLSNDEYTVLFKYEDDGVDEGDGGYLVFD